MGARGQGVMYEGEGGGAEGACESTCGGRRPCMGRVAYEGKGGSYKGTCVLG